MAPLAVATAANSAHAAVAAGAKTPWAWVATAAWGIGLTQLLLLGTLVSARLLLVPLSRDDEVLPYWVFMGIAGLAVLAGLEVSPGPVTDPVVATPAISTFAIVLWCFATWLFPLMIAMTVWHARHRRDRLVFRLAMWSMVFPVGVYAAASEAFGRVHSWGWLEAFGTVISWIALALWLIVACISIVHVAGLVRTRAASHHQ